MLGNTVHIMPRAVGTSTVFGKDAECNALKLLRGKNQQRTHTQSSEVREPVCMKFFVLN